MNIDKQLGLDIVINGKQELQFSSLTINRTVSQFVDTFDVNMANSGGSKSTTIPIGCILNAYKDGIEIFRGLVEDKKTTWNNIGSTMTLSGREELVYLTEDDITPTLGPFKGVTDNSILELVFADFNWDLELGEGVIIKEYAIQSGSVRKGQVVDDILKYNDFILIKKGLTIRKTKLPISFDSAKVKDKITITQVDGQFSIHNQRIEKIQVNESISGVRNKITGYTYASSKAKLQVKMEKENASLTGGDYAQRLRNKSDLQGQPISRHRYVTTPAKDAGELTGQVTRLLKESDIVASIELAVYGVADYDLLDILDIRFEQEKILQYMYIDTLTYNFDSKNKTTTTILVKPFPVINN